MVHFWNNINWDAISGITQIITVGYLYYQFHYLPIKEKKSAIENLQVIFNTSKEKCKKLRDEMEIYSTKEMRLVDEFLPGITFLSQINQLDHLLNTEFEFDISKNLDIKGVSKELLATMTTNVMQQLASFTQMEAHFNTAHKFNFGV